MTATKLLIFVVFVCWLLAAFITPAPQLSALGPALAWFFGGFDLGPSRVYVSAWHQAPTADRNGDFRLHLELFTIRRASASSSTWPARSRAWAHSAMTSAPEAAAARLRQLG